jgi:hypothetical protein
MAFADVNTDVRRENTDVRWAGLLPPFLDMINGNCSFLQKVLGGAMSCSGPNAIKLFLL